ncbi:hypothetical protein EH70_00310 [Streptococcus equinus]|uniref:hypothetical protein n=1 Tax=Streptococcus equinus TaxID=1335 RepID=UPI0004DA1B0A|nr:hypothetical protein [Streptococcus equinus]KEY48731.1 hypothetical protein EH70_00310 [Streptococcus equinus]
MKNKLLLKLISNWYKKEVELIIAPVFIGVNYILFYLLNVFRLYSDHIGIEVIYLGIFIINSISLIFQLTVASNMYKEHQREIEFFRLYNLDKMGLLILMISKRFFLMLLEIGIGCVLGVVYLKPSLLLLSRLIEEKVLVGDVKIVNILLPVVIVQGAILGISILYDIKHIFVREKNILKRIGKSKNKAFLTLILLLISWNLFTLTKANFLSLILLFIAIIGLTVGLYHFFKDLIPIFIDYLLNKLHCINSKTFLLLTRFKSICLKNSFNLFIIVLLGSFWLLTVTLVFSFYTDKKDITQSGSELDTIIINSNVSSKTLGMLSKAYQVNLGTVYSSSLGIPRLATVNNGILSDTTSSLSATNYLSVMSLENYNKLYQEDLSIKDNEVYVYAPSSIKITRLELLNKKYVVKRVKDFKLSFNYNHALHQTVFVITNDANLLKTPQMTVTGFNISGKKENCYEFSIALQDKEGYINENYTSKVLSYSTLIKFFGGILFIGLCISCVLFLVLGTFLNTNKYFSFDKIEKEVVSMLNYDLTFSDIKFLLFTSYSLVFWLAIGLIYLNSKVAISAVKNIVVLFSFYDVQLLNRLFHNFFIAFIIITSLIFLISIKSYSTKVNCSIYDYADITIKDPTF